MKQLEVQIMQQSYLLGCPEGQDQRLLQAVARVDVAMTKIRDAGKVRARDRIAVLAALNLAFEIADREASLSSAIAALPPVNNSNNASQGDNSDVATAGTTATDAARLQGLLRRLDDALESDNRLL